MTPENEWDVIKSRSGPLLGAAGMGMLRVALLFGSAAAALALILAPAADRYSRAQVVGIDGVDLMATGSIGKANAYTIRKSVLQEPGAICIIRDNGARSGDC
jgi:hypothetical protein